MNRLTTKQYFLPMAMLVAAAMLLGTAWLGDDAFITLRVIDNFVNGYGLRYNVIERVQVFTHPLWFWFLTPFYALTREAMFTTMLVSVLVSLGGLWLLANRIAKNAEYGSLLVLAAVASGTLCSFSTSGLENPLTFILLTLFVRQLFHSEKAWIPAAIAGLLFLNRLDMAILAGPATAYLLIQTRGADRAKTIVAAMMPALAWIGFSLVYYGMPFPNTAYAKLGTGFSRMELMMRGLEYAKDFLLHDPLLALLIAVAVFDALRSRDRKSMMLGAGIVLYVAYTIIIGGDFMSGRFFAAPGFMALCLLARIPVPSWLDKLNIKRVGFAAVGGLAVLLVVRVTEQPINSMMIPDSGIVDERRFYYATAGLVPVLTGWLKTGNKPLPPQGLRGLELKSMGQRSATPIVVSATATGMRGYFGGQGVHVLDKVALTDAFLARLPAVPGSRVGHYQRVYPPGYAETVIDAHPSTNIEALRLLLNDVTLVTRAPLFSEGRWDAIWRLLSGQYHWVYETDIYSIQK